MTLGILAQPAAAADTAPTPGIVIAEDRAGHYVTDGDRVLYTQQWGAEESAYDELHLYDLSTRFDKVLVHDVEAGENSFALTGQFAVFVESMGAQEVAGRVPDQTWWWRSLLFDGKNLVWTTDKETVALDVTSHKDYHLAVPYGAAAVRDGRVLVSSVTAPCGPTAVSLVLWEPATDTKRTLTTGSCDIRSAQINGEAVTWSDANNKSLSSLNLATHAHRALPGGR
jgi:hypothetical protein